MLTRDVNTKRSLSEPERPFPLIRVWTFGRFCVEQLVADASVEAPEPRYAPVTKSQWHGRGSARMLLRFLLCRGGCRRVPREVIIESLWPHDYDKEGNTSASLSAAAHNLRSVLQTGDGTALLTIERATDTTIYALADQSRLWVDVDKFESLLDLAARAERQGEDSLPLLEAAHHLSRGEFLEDERNSPWAEARRQVIEAAQQRCVRQLAELYYERNLRTQAEMFLQQALADDPCDEDVLCRLMLLLSEQGAHQEALRLYRRTERELQEIMKCKPARRTVELAERIRNEPVTLERKPFTNVINIQPSSQGHPTETGVSSRVHEPLHVERVGIVIPGILNGIQIDDPAICYGLMHSYITDLICRWSGQHLSFDGLQEGVDQQIRRLDQMYLHTSRSEQEGQAWHISRRQAIIAIASMPTSLLLHIQEEQTSPLVAEEFLPCCAASIASSWHLTGGKDFPVVEYILHQYLPPLENLAQQPSRHQKVAAALTSQGYQLAGLLDLHRNDLLTRETHAKQAVKYAYMAEDNHLLVAALLKQADTFYYSKSATQMLHTYQETLQYVDDVSPLLRSRVYLGLADAYAQCGLEQEAKHYMGLAQDTPPAQRNGYPTTPYVGVGPYSLLLSQGRVLLDLDHANEAEKVLTNVNKPSMSTIIPERMRIEITNLQAEAAINMRDMDRFVTYITIGRNGAVMLGSEKRYQEAFDIYKQGRSVWPREIRVRALGELFVR